MALAQEDIEQIQTLIIKSIQATPEVGNANVRYELELRERTTRVEEELKHQRELMLAGFAQMDKRFEQARNETDKRFEQVDKQLEQMRNESDRRFEQVEKRFEQVEKRFEQVEKRFEQVEKHFEKIDKQFELQSKAIMDIHQEIKLQMRWSFGVLIAVGGLVVGVLRMGG